MEHVDTLQFVIDGPWLTEFTRSLWADELELQKALNILNCLHGMTEETAMRILTGHAKLVGDSKTGITLDDDSATESKYGGGLAMSIVVGRIQKQSEAVEREVTIRRQHSMGMTKFMASPFGPIHVPHLLWNEFQEGKIGWDQLEPYRNPEWAEEAEVRGFLREERKARLKKSRELMETMPIEEEPPPPPPKKPEPDTDLSSRNGWISPDGKFYGCMYSGHIDLAIRLGFDEGQIEKRWIKIQKDYSDSMALILQPERRVTQRQRDTVWDWCQKHEEEVPWWFEDEDA